MPPHGRPNANSKSSPGPSRILGIMSSIIPGPGVPAHAPPPRSSATIVAFFDSLPRRYSTWTVSPGSSARARSINFIAGPESSSSCAFAPASAVPRNRVMMSPALRPAFSAGPPGVIPSIRAPTLSPVASACGSTITPIRPRLPPSANTLYGPDWTRTRGRLGVRARGASCAPDAAGTIKLTASAAIVMLRSIIPPGP